MFPKKSIGWIFALALLVITAGCSSKEERASVRGRVSYQGKPLGNALVVFMPETPNFLPSSGLTNANGQYELMTLAPSDGAAIGKCRVTITARGADKEAKGDQPGLTGSNAVPGEPLIPVKYFSPETSGLTADVKPGGGTINFDLTDK